VAESKFTQCACSADECSFERLAVSFEFRLRNESEDMKKRDNETVGCRKQSLKSCSERKIAIYSCSW